jgi:hypothetical protein
MVAKAEIPEALSTRSRNGPSRLAGQGGGVAVALRFVDPGWQPPRFSRARQDGQTLTREPLLVL